MSAPWDLTPLLTDPPVGPAQPMSYRQGLVIDWDPVTLENVVRVGGTDLEDLPVLGVAEAASITSGSTVGIMTVGSTWAILGRIVTPGTTQATDAITLVSQRIVSSTVAAAESTSAAGFVDLTTAGPAVTIQIPASGRALVLLSSTIYSANSDPTSKSGQMSYTISGATTRAAHADRALVLQSWDDHSSAEHAIAATYVSLAEDLTPGTNTFTAKYTGATSTALFGNRNITVFAL